MEEIYKDRDQFASLVRKMASPDVGRMGIQILSFTIKEVFDNVTYLQSLGKSNCLKVKQIKVKNPKSFWLSKERNNSKTVNPLVRGHTQITLAYFPIFYPLPLPVLLLHVIFIGNTPYLHTPQAFYFLAWKGLNVSFFPGTAQTASVKRDAEIGVAQANRDAGIREAECEKTAMDVKYNTGMTT